MSILSINQAIEAKFRAGWDSNTTPIKLDNVAVLIKGTGTVSDETKLSQWCRFSVIPSDAFRADIGTSSKMVRYTGNVIVSLFVKAGTDTDKAYALAQAAIELMQNDYFDGVTTRAAIPVNVGQTPNGSFYQINVTVPFTSTVFYE